jgi:hypothetical protein
MREKKQQVPPLRHRVRSGSGRNDKCSIQPSQSGSKHFVSILGLDQSDDPALAWVVM